MAKSKGNVVTVDDALAIGTDPAVLRYFLLSTHYRRTLNYTAEALEASAAGLQRIKDFLRELEKGVFPPGSSGKAEALVESAETRFRDGLEDDLNISVALTGLFDLIHESHLWIRSGRFGTEDARCLSAFVRKLDGVLAVLPPLEEAPLPEEIKALIAERERARKARDFRRADEIRDRLLREGIVLEDTKDGVRWKNAGTKGKA